MVHPVCIGHGSGRFTSSSDGATATVSFAEAAAPALPRAGASTEHGSRGIMSSRKFALEAETTGGHPKTALRDLSGSKVGPDWRKAGEEYTAERGMARVAHTPPAGCFPEGYYTDNIAVLMLQAASGPAPRGKAASRRQERRHPRRRQQLGVPRLPWR